MPSWIAAFDSAAMGPVEQIQSGPDGSALTVLGQVYHTTGETAGSVQVGDYVIAAGDAAGNLGVLYPLNTSYVAGASPVSVVGVVSSADASVAAFTVGGVVVDYSAYLASDPTYEPSAGSLVQARGTQPAIGGQLLVGSAALLPADSGSTDRQ